MALNAWGYEVANLPALISLADFKVLTGNSLSSTDAQITDVIDAVSQVVRDYCGWHVSPNVACTWQGDGDGRLVQLPAMFITDVTSVKVCGRTLSPSEFQWKEDGLLRLAKPLPDNWGRLVEVGFSAGIPTDAIAAVVSQVAVNYLVAPAGVSSEMVGSAMITYNATGYGIAGGIRLHATDKATLAQYRITR